MNKREESRLKRHRRIRMTLSGTKERPRVLIRRSLKNIFVCAIDDTANKILCSLSTLDKDIKSKFPYAGNVKAAELCGAVFAAKIKDKGVTRIVFDRAGYLYHGRVKAFADALRKGGLEF